MHDEERTAEGNLYRFVANDRTSKPAVSLLVETADRRIDRVFFKDLLRVDGLCCTNPGKDSFHESSMVAGVHEQLGPDEVQDHELVVLQYRAETARISVNLV